MTVDATPLKPLEEVVSYACTACQGKSRAIFDINADIRRIVGRINSRPDGRGVPAAKEKILELKDRREACRAQLQEHVSSQH